MHHTFPKGDRSGLQAGRSGTRTLLLRRHAVETRAECVSASSCWNKQRRPWRRPWLDGSTCCSNTCMYLSACVVPSLMCKLPMMPRALTHPRTIIDAGVWTLHWQQSGWSFSSLARRKQHPRFPKTIWNVDSSDHRTLFHCLSVHLRWARAHRGFTLHGRVLTCTSRFSDKLC